MMNHSIKRDDKILTKSQARLIVALHDTDLNLNAAAAMTGMSVSSAAGKVRSIEHHTGVDVLTLYGLGQFYDGARALVEHWEGRHGQAD